MTSSGCYEPEGMSSLHMLQPVAVVDMLMACAAVKEGSLHACPAAAGVLKSSGA